MVSFFWFFPPPLTLVRTLFPCSFLGAHLTFVGGLGGGQGGAARTKDGKRTVHNLAMI